MDFVNEETVLRPIDFWLLHASIICADWTEDKIDNETLQDSHKNFMHLLFNALYYESNNLKITIDF